MAGKPYRCKCRFLLKSIGIVAPLAIFSGCGSAPEKGEDRQPACTTSSHNDQPRANFHLGPALPTADAPCVIRMTAYIQRRSPVETIIGSIETKSSAGDTQSETLRLELRASDTGMKSATLEFETGDKPLCRDLEITARVDACLWGPHNGRSCPSIRVLKEDTFAGLEVVSQTSTVCYD